MERTRTINGWQLVCLMTLAQTGGIFRLGRLTEKSHSVWLALFPAMLLPVAALWLISRSLSGKTYASLPERTGELFGRKTGCLLLILFILTNLLQAAAILRLQLELVGINLLTRTPVPLVAAISLCTACWTVNRGAAALARLHEVLFYGFMILLAFFISPILREAQVTNLLPLQEWDAPVIARSALRLSLLYSGMGTLFVWAPGLREKEKPFSRSVTGILIAAGAWLFLLMGAILVYGADIMEYMLWPVLSLLKIVPHYLIQRLDFFVLGLWIGVGLCPVMNLLFAAAASVPAAEENRHMVFRRASILFSLFLWGLVLIPGSIVESYLFMDCLSAAGSVLTLVFAGIMWIGGLVHEKKRTS